MIIKYHSTFLKHYKKRITPYASLKKKFKERVVLFLANKSNPLIHNHPLGGDLEGYCAFSISGDVRVIYKYESDDIILFCDVGSHNQVYK